MHGCLGQIVDCILHTVLQRPKFRLASDASMRALSSNSIERAAVTGLVRSTLIGRVALSVIVK